MCHFNEEQFINLANLRSIFLLIIGKNMCCPMDESIAFLDVRPQWFCGCYSFCEQPMQCIQGRWQCFFLCDSFQGGYNEGKPLVQFETRSRKGRMPIIGQSTTDSKAVLPRNGGFLILPSLDFALNRMAAVIEKLLVEFVENPTRERLVQWMGSMVYDTGILTDEFVQLRWEAATDPDAPADIKKLYNRAMLEGMRRGRAFGAADSVAMLTKIQAPTLVMFGRDDRVTPLDGSLAAMRLIPKCELHVFYDCGHWAMIERKDEFESTVLAFLARDRKE